MIYEALLLVWLLAIVFSRQSYDSPLLGSVVGPSSLAPVREVCCVLPTSLPLHCCIVTPGTPTISQLNSPTARNIDDTLIFMQPCSSSNPVSGSGICRDEPFHRSFKLLKNRNFSVATENRIVSSN